MSLWGDFVITIFTFFFNKITHMLYSYCGILLMYNICPSIYYHYRSIIPVMTLFSSSAQT